MGIGTGIVEVGFAHSLNYELDFAEADYGTEVPGTTLTANVSTDVFGVPLRRLLADRGASPPTEWSLYGGQFDVWLIPHSVSFLRDGGFREITSVGVEVTYDVGKKTCSIVSLLPKADFVERGSLTMRASVSQTGAVTASVDPASVRVEELGLTVGASSKASAELGASVALEAKVWTPRIQAIGVGGRQATWVFEAADKPLYGHDLLMWSAVALPSDLAGRTLTYKLRTWITHRLAFVPTRWEHEVVDVKCRLLAPDHRDSK